MTDDGKGEVRFGEQLTARGHWLRSLLTTGPGILWVTVFLLLPLAWIGVLSFLTRGESGGFALPFTFDNYKRFAGSGIFGFDWHVYPSIIGRSIGLGAGTAALCVIAALPLAFFIVGLPGRSKNAALTLVLIPFWTNLLIRTYAWQILLGPSLCPSTLAVYLGMVCDYLPFLLLPLYASVEKIDWSVAEAASDLGANGPRVFWHAILPQVTPGLVAGIILVFIPATGQYVIPDLLGGGKVQMLGNVIQQQFGGSRDWPFGSAIAFVAMGVVLLGLWVYARVAGEKGGELL